jgi:hypothetical protein
MATAERPLSILDLLDDLAADVRSRKVRLFVAACCRRVWPLLVDERSRQAVAAAEDFADGRLGRPELIESWTEADAVWDHLGRQSGGGPHASATPQMEAASMVADGMMAFSFVQSAEAEREAERGRAKAVALLSRKLAAECAALAAARPQTERLQAEWAAAAAAAGLTAVSPLGADCDEESLADPHLAEEYQRLQGAFEEEVRSHRPAALRAEQAFQHALFDDLFRAPHGAADADWPTWRDGAAGQLAREIYDGRGFDRLPELADALQGAGCAEAAALRHCRDGKPHARGCWVLDLLLGRE